MTPKGTAKRTAKRAADESVQHNLSAMVEMRLCRGGENLLDDSRLALLEQIAATGSITKAGKAVGISYRTAWVTVDHLNGIAEDPLVERTTGGKSGGGSRLTPEGESLLRVYRIMREEHGKYLERLREGILDFDRFLNLTRKTALKTSARNQLFGVVESIRKEGLKAVVDLRLKGKDRITSQITLEGLESLGLRKGEEAYALIKANWISLDLATDITNEGIGAKGTGERTGKAADKGEVKTAGLMGYGSGASENRLGGEIVSVKRGEGVAEVVLRLAGGNTLAAMIPLSANPHLTPSGGRIKTGWRIEGGNAIATFSASNVILGVAR